MTEEKPIRRIERERQPAPSEWFVGNVEIENVHGNRDLALGQGRVHFHDGARTKWHLHTGDQVLYFVAGVGMAQNHDGTVFECQPGDIVHVPPGTRHIHGAMPGHDATHIAITQGNHVWETDADYPG
ncbi:MAG: cupin domain-containing protein [Acidimicrobiia bacterium]|nr:cupin domain-containing protein [Acidimicrobiia bacterium]